METTSVSAFMSAAPAPMNGSSPWASRYAADLRRVVHEQARNSARTLQKALGPSELGTACDRQVVGKLVGQPVTNHVVDPWPSVVGTAVHVWLADAFTADNQRHGLRWLAESRVRPHPDHPGTADLYDGREQVVVDHKVLGESTMAKVRSAGGPPHRYVVQLLLYGWGYILLGFPVKRIALAAYPRTAGTLDGLYVWDHVWSPADDEAVEAVWEITAKRKAMAAQVTAGRATIDDIPTTPSDDECYFCPFYRPQAAREPGPGCPGKARVIA